MRIELPDDCRQIGGYLVGREAPEGPRAVATGAVRRQADGTRGKGGLFLCCLFSFLAPAGRRRPHAWMYSQILLHSVFSTKHRGPWIAPHVADRLYAHMGGIIRAEKVSLRHWAA